MSYQLTYPVDAPSELAAGFVPSVVSALGSSWFITVLRSKNTLDLPVAGVNTINDAGTVDRARIAAGASGNRIQPVAENTAGPGLDPHNVAAER